jgi:hypothetical protein
MFNSCETELYSAVVESAGDLAVYSLTTLENRGK